MRSTNISLCFVAWICVGCSGQATDPTRARGAESTPTLWHEDAPAGPIALLDVDGDGRLDLVATAKGQPLTVRRGDGRGGFAETTVPIGTAVSWPSEVALGDHDGDGRLDVYVAVHESSHVRVYTNDGRGLAEAADSPLGVTAAPHLHSVSVGDVDGDGRADLLTDSWGDDRVYVRRTGATQASTASFVVGSQPRSNIRLADIDGDGALDIVAPAWQEAAVTVLLGDGAGEFRPASNSPSPTAEGPFYVAFPDFDGDGTREILVAHRAGNWSENEMDALTLLRYDGHGKVERDPRFQAPAGRSPTPIAVCDLDDDGTLDAVVANAAGRDLTLLYGSKSGPVRAVRTQPLGGAPVALACGELRSEGPAQVVVATEGPDQLRVLAPMGTHQDSA